MKNKQEGHPKKWIDRFRHKYRLVIMQEDTFEEKLSFRLSRLNVFTFAALLAVFLIASTIYLIAYTPLKQYIPGYSDIELRESLYEQIKRTDSLERVVEARNAYVHNLKNVLEGNTELLQDTTGGKKDTSMKKNYENIRFDRSREDSMLRNEIREMEQYSLIYYEPENRKGIYNNPSSIRNFFFFSPMRGRITSGFNPDAGHYGVDIAGEKDEAVKATLDGRIIFANWTTETGYVIALMHQNNLISVYKHNATLLKEQGENVKAGDPIAISGNTGELSSGPHLHFELWHNGNPINPREYISF